MDENKFKQFVFIVLYCFLLLMLIVNIVGGQSIYLFFPTALMALIFLLKARNYWFSLVIILTSLTGSVPLLFGFSYWDIIAGLIVAIWISEKAHHTANNQRLQGRFIWLAMCGYCGILIWHVISSKMGLGDSQGGKRLAITAGLLVVICYIIQSQYFNISSLKRLPEYGLIPGVFKAGLEIINFLVPPAIYYTYLIYEGLNFESIWNVATSGRIAITRLAELRSAGMFLVLFCGVRFAFLKRSIYSFRSILLIIGIALGLILTLLAGYRSYFVMSAMAMVICVWFRSRKITWIAVGCGVLLVLGLISYQSSGGHLPYAVQRTLSWIPGPWDSYIVIEANRGIDWRMEIWTRFLYFIFPEHPWLGRGQHFIENESSYTMYYDPYWLYYYGQMLHSGFLSALDYVGIIGTLLLIMANIRALYCSFRLLVTFRARLQPWMLWVLTYYLIHQPIYWLTLSFKGYFVALSICMSTIELAYNSICAHPTNNNESSTMQVCVKRLKNIS